MCLGIGIRSSRLLRRLQVHRTVHVVRLRVVELWVGNTNYQGFDDNDGCVCCEDAIARKLARRLR